MDRNVIFKKISKYSAHMHNFDISRSSSPVVSPCCALPRACQAEVCRGPVVYTVVYPVVQGRLCLDPSPGSGQPVPLCVLPLCLPVVDSTQWTLAPENLGLSPLSPPPGSRARALSTTKGDHNGGDTKGKQIRNYRTLTDIYSDTQRVLTDIYCDI